MSNHVGSSRGDVVGSWRVIVRRCFAARPLVGILAAALFIIPTATVASEALLHSFNYTDGAYNIYSNLAFDAAGNLYGTTQFGGTAGCGLESCGVAFELKPTARGKWTEKVVHTFSQCDALGFFPRAGFAIDAQGNLYGTTSASGCSGVGPGTAFELSPNKSGGWTEKLLHQFALPVDGESPQAAMTFDASGNLYGTTALGGINYNGTIFELLPVGSGNWTKKTLHLFRGLEGYSPSSKLTVDSAGNLYGTTTFGGAHRSACGNYGCGTVFELSPGSSGSWKLKVLHSFGDPGDGASPVSALTLDSAGNLFGVTAQGGLLNPACLPYGCGTLYELVREKDGRWREQIIHDFGSGTDGNLPRGDLSFDKAGALYGTATDGGAYGAGMAFRFTQGARGKWNEQVLHNFGIGKDGINPYTGMIFDAAYNLYGTTASGGTYRAGMCQKSSGCGTVFQLTPP